MRCAVCPRTPRAHSPEAKGCVERSHGLETPDGLRREERTLMSIVYGVISGTCAILVRVVAIS